MERGKGGTEKLASGNSALSLPAPAVPEASQPVFYLIILLSSEFTHLSTNSC